MRQNELEFSVHSHRAKDWHEDCGTDSCCPLPRGNASHDDASNRIWIVFDELLTRVIVLLLILQVGIQHAQTDSGKSNQEAQTFPDLVTTRVFTSSCCRSRVSCTGKSQLATNHMRKNCCHFQFPRNLHKKKEKKEKKGFSLLVRLQ